MVLPSLNPSRVGSTQLCGCCTSHFFKLHPPSSLPLLDTYPRFGGVPLAVNGSISLPMKPAKGTNPSCLSDSETPPVALACTLPDLYTSFSPFRVTCVVPPGAGVEWLILIRGFWTSIASGGVVVGYEAPTVSAVVPSRLPITGGSVRIEGSGFGLAPCHAAGPATVSVFVTQAPPGPAALVFDPATSTWQASAPGTASLVRARTPCVLQQWAPTVIECQAPPGLDATVELHIVVGGQENVTTSLLGYLPPTVSSVVVAAPGSMGTAGGSFVTLLGANFPVAPWPLAVTARSDLCTVVEDTRTTAAVTCRVPRGAGVSALGVFTPLQASPSTATLAYDPPMITVVTTPSSRPIEGGFELLVSGKVRCSNLVHNAG